MKHGCEIGVMQGRLLPKFKGRYQAHPIGYWQEEFAIAANFGIKLIEFILDFNEVERNPLLSESGVKEILEISEKTGVRVKTVCADYFMEAPFHSLSEQVVAESQEILEKLLNNGKELGLTDIVIPCVDQSSLDSVDAADRFIQNIGLAVELAEKNGINISLETDLAPNTFKKVLEKIHSDRVTVNYDTGNSAALGYDINEEFAAYGEKISDIHIKDRIYKGGSVELGTGSWDYPAFFKLLKQIDYKGPVIMQAYRDDEGVQIFKKQLEWFNEKA